MVISLSLLSLYVDSFALQLGIDQQQSFIYSSQMHQLEIAQQRSSSYQHEPPQLEFVQQKLNTFQHNPQLELINQTSLFHQKKPIRLEMAPQESSVYSQPLTVENHRDVDKEARTAAISMLKGYYLSDNLFRKSVAYRINSSNQNSTHLVTILLR
ncbi:hypothetical protein AB6A40_002084 [Gnathostoma spinigerum]|uniref:Uncharacterized protein n=1 Tax=Gnathostoma spinigerum TaxID=75299 RepID=A0ABD6EGD9_9BILA